MDKTQIAKFVLLAVSPGADTSVLSVLRNLAAHPGTLLVHRWNWKASLFSSLIRGLLFLGTNLSAGWNAAAGAALAEFFYRSATAGFYGALTQSFRRVEPKWHATVAVLILLPLTTHTLEIAVHVWRETPNLIRSIAASACLTILSTTFNLYAMRRGTLVVGAGGQSLAADLRALPQLITGYLCAGPVALFHLLGKSRR